MQGGGGGGERALGGGIIAQGSKDVSLLGVPFSGKNGIMGIQFLQSGEAHGSMGMHSETRKDLELVYIHSNNVMNLASY